MTDRKRGSMSDTSEGGLTGEALCPCSEPGWFHAVAFHAYVAAREAEARAEGQSRLLEQYGYINAAEARAEADEAERDALRAAVAHVVRDHGMPPNKDQHGYDYRMGWWDAVLYLDKIITRGVGVCEDCPGRAALSATPTEGPAYSDGEAVRKLVEGGA